jgi:hypothetical protein
LLIPLPDQDQLSRAQMLEEQVYLLKIRDVHALNETNQLLDQLRSQEEQRSYVQQVLDLIQRVPFPLLNLNTAPTTKAEQVVVRDAMELYECKDEEFIAVIEVVGWRKMLKRLRRDFLGRIVLGIALDIMDSSDYENYNPDDLQDHYVSVHELIEVISWLRNELKGFRGIHSVLEPILESHELSRTLAKISSIDSLVHALNQIELEFRNPRLLLKSVNGTDLAQISGRLQQQSVKQCKP